MLLDELQKLSKNEIEEILEYSSVVLKKIFSKEESNKIENFIDIRLNIGTNDIEYFIKNNKIGKIIHQDDSSKLLVFSYKLQDSEIELDEKYEDGKDIFGNKKIYSGFYDIDKRVNLQKGKLVIVASRPSVGKSSLITNMALFHIEDNLSVGVYSFEAKKDDFYMRMISIKCSIPLTSLYKNNIDDIQRKNIESSFQDIKNKELNIDNNSYTLKSLINKIKRDCIIYKFDVVYIDCIQLIKQNLINEQSRYLDINQISRELKILANELDILLIVTSQLNRNVENRADKRPYLNDLRDSGTLEDDADIVLFIYRDDIYKQRDEVMKEKEARDKGEEYRSTFVNKPVEEAEIIVAKQRNGVTGTIKLDFQKHLTRFIDKEEFAPIEVIFEKVSKESEIEFPDIL